MSKTPVFVRYISVFDRTPSIVINNQEHEPSLNRLCYALSLLRGSSGAFLCYCNSVLLRDAITLEIARRIRADVQCLLVQEPDILGYLIGETKAGSVVLLVIEPGKETKFLKYANLRRELLWQIKSPVVVWLPIEINARIEAPDFHVFCRGHYYFCLSANWIKNLVEAVLQMTVEGKIDTQDAGKLISIAFEESFRLSSQDLLDVTTTIQATKQSLGA